MARLILREYRSSGSCYKTLPTRLADYPNVQAWLARVAEQPGFAGIDA